MRWTGLIGIAIVLALICEPFVLATADSYGNHWYEVFQQNGISWDAAKTAATGKGGYLVTIESEAENIFVCSLASDTTKGNDKLWFDDGYGNKIGPWIGAYQEPGSLESDKDGWDKDWKWISSTGGGEPTPMTQAFWGATEPNNAGNEDFACIGYFGRSGFGWADYGRNTNGYIVEFDSIPTPFEINAIAVGFSPAKTDEFGITMWVKADETTRIRGEFIYSDPIDKTKQRHFFDEKEVSPTEYPSGKLVDLKATIPPDATDIKFRIYWRNGDKWIPYHNMEHYTIGANRAWELPVSD